MSKKPPSHHTEQVVRRLFAAPVTRLARRVSRDGVHPVTALRAMEREMKAADQAVVAKHGGGMMEELLNAIRNDPRALEPPSIPTPDSDLAKVVCEQFDALDRAFPFGTVAMLSAIDFETRDRNVTAMTVHLRRRAGRARGPGRADAIQAFAHHVLESEYGWFLRVLVNAANAASGRPVVEFRTFGQVFRAAQDRQVLGGLLWPEARTIRNAMSHDGGWSFVPDKNVVSVRDENRGPFLFELPALFHRLDEVSRAPQMLAFAHYRAQVRDMLGTIAPAFVNSVREGDSSAFTSAMTLLQPRYDAACLQLGALGWAPTS